MNRAFFPTSRHAFRPPNIRIRENRRLTNEARHSPPSTHQSRMAVEPRDQYNVVVVPIVYVLPPSLHGPPSPYSISEMACHRCWKEGPHQWSLPMGLSHRPREWPILHASSFSSVCRCHDHSPSRGLTTFTPLLLRHAAFLLFFFFSFFFSHIRWA